MRQFITKPEIAAVAEGAVSAAYGGVFPETVDIDRVAAHLGLSVVYQNIAPEENAVGFYSGGGAPLRVSRGGAVVTLDIPARTAVLDNYLKGREHYRRFTLAHETAHLLLELCDGAGAAPAARSDGSETTIDELRRHLRYGEILADTGAAFLLMPRGTLLPAFARRFGSREIPVYGGRVFLPRHRAALAELAEELGVSYPTLAIQVRDCGLAAPRPWDGYFKATGKETAQ